MQINNTGCTLGNFQHFDTCRLTSDVTNMVNYLNGLAADDKLYVGVTHDDAANSLLPAYGGKEALLSVFGVDVSSLEVRGSNAFLAKVNQPNFASSIVKARGLGPLTVVATMSCKYAIIMTQL